MRILREQENQRAQEDLQERIRDGWIGYWSDGERKPYYYNAVTEEVVRNLLAGVTAHAMQEPVRLNKTEAVLPTQERPTNVMEQHSASSSSTQPNAFGHRLVRLIMKAMFLRLHVNQKDKIP